jgi:hypothetical protein
MSLSEFFYLNDDYLIIYWDKNCTFQIRALFRWDNLCAYLSTRYHVGTIATGTYSYYKNYKKKSILLVRLGPIVLDLPFLQKN